MLPAFVAKLCPRAELQPRLAALPRPLVFTNGVFDILHRGHVTYLAQARALGASLVLGLNSDASARAPRQGAGPAAQPRRRPGDACCAALESVSLVTLFDEATPLELLKLVRPELYVKGGDYDIETLAETALRAQLGRRRDGAAVRRGLLDDRAGRADPPLSAAPCRPSRWRGSRAASRRMP